MIHSTNQIKYMFQQNIQNVLVSVSRSLVSECEELLNFLIFYYGKSNMFGFWTVGVAKQDTLRHQLCETGMGISTVFMTFYGPNDQSNNE